MDASAVLAGRSPLVTYPVESDIQMHEAVINAFLAADIDVFATETPISDQLDVDALTGFDWATTPSLLLAVELWDHQVVITRDTVRIYPNG